MEIQKLHVLTRSFCCFNPELSSKKTSTCCLFVTKDVVLKENQEAELFKS